MLIENAFSETLRMINDQMCADDIATATGFPVESIRVWQRKHLPPAQAWWCSLPKVRQEFLLDNRWLLLEAAFEAGQRCKQRIEEIDSGFVELRELIGHQIDLDG